MLAYAEIWHTPNPGIFRTVPWLHSDTCLSETCRIYENLPKFRTLTYLKLDTYSEPSQRLTRKFFAKIVIFPKCSILYLWNGFKYAHLSMSTIKIVEWPIVWDTLRTLFLIINSDIFRHIHILFRDIQSYCDIIRTLFNSSLFRTLPRSESYI